MPLVDSEASSLVNTNELLEFIDTIGMGKADSTKQSEITVNSEGSSTSEHPMEQTSADPKLEGPSFTARNSVEIAFCWFRLYKLLGNVVRVYPRIVQGLMFLSA